MSSLSEAPSPSPDPIPLSQHRALDRAPCGIEQVPTGPLSHPWGCMHASPNLPARPALLSVLPTLSTLPSRSLHFCSYPANTNPSFLSILTPCIDHTACVTHTGLLDTQCQTRATGRPSKDVCSDRALGPKARSRSAQGLHLFCIHLSQV